MALKTTYDRLLRERPVNHDALVPALVEAKKAVALAERLLLKPEANHVEAHGMRARDLGKIARIHYLAERFDLAESHFAASRDAFVALDKVRAVFMCDLRMSVLLAEHGRTGQAVDGFQRLITEVEAHPETLENYRPFVHFHWASAMLIAQDQAQARTHLVKARELWSKKRAKRLSNIVEEALESLST